MTMNNDNGPIRWGHFRFAIIGKLLASRPNRGELREKLAELAANVWEHPVTGEPVRFSLSTLERWYYTAQQAGRDPVGALDRQSRKDTGGHPSISQALATSIANLYEDHPSWSYQLHYDNLAALADKDAALRPLPSYSSVRRYMRAHGLSKKPRRSDKDRGVRRGKGHREVRSYECQYVNGLWHLDFHKGSRALLSPSGEWKKPLLLGILDDHSRLSCHGQWYWDETAETLVHGFCQAIQKRGLPRALMSDGGSAMKSAEFRTGLLDLGIDHSMTLPYSPYQNGKQESFWNQVENRFLAMLEGCKDLTLELLNEAYQAYTELSYNQTPHSELGMPPYERYLSGTDVGRSSPDSDELRRAFRQQTRRKQRLSDGTVSIQGRRFEVPSQYRYQRQIAIRYARWDLRSVAMVDARTGTQLCRLFPVDKANNADARRRILKPLPQDAPDDTEPKESGIAPLLQSLLAEYAATGLPPGYLTKSEPGANTSSSADATDDSQSTNAANRQRPDEQYDEQ